jgi:peptidoglycan/xylan/chitin deacetylase (PgdA/CDA1 family)
MNSQIRKYSRDVFLRIFGSFARPAKGIYILNSHFASPQNPSFEKYCEFLFFLKKNCELIRIEDAVSLIDQRIVSKECSLSFTFDDGFEECYSIIAPALEEFKTNAAFFINGNFLNGDLKYREYFTNIVTESPGKLPMSWAQVVDLSERGHVIGSHTLDHINMNSKDYDQIDYQLKANKQLIEENTNRPCDYFAYPFGQLDHINEDTLHLAQKYHQVIFSAANYKKYYSFSGKVLNRRHIESWWPESHIHYFLSATRKY